MQPRKPPPFPLDAIDIVEKAERLGLVDHVATGANPDLPPEISGWEIRIPVGTKTGDEGKRLMACAMAMGGGPIIGVGQSGSIWVWDIHPAPSRIRSSRVGSHRDVAKQDVFVLERA